MKEEKDLIYELTEIRKAFDEFFVSKNPMMMVSDPFWRPPMDIFDTPEYTLIRLELAGMQKSDVDISLQDDRLIITGERRNLVDESLPARSYRHMEIKYAAFQREVLLSHSFEEDKISATYHDGFLEIKVFRHQEPKKTSKVKIKIDEES